MQEIPAYCRQCDDWFYNKSDTSSITDVGFCTMCYAGIRKGTAIKREKKNKTSLDIFVKETKDKKKLVKQRFVPPSSIKLKRMSNLEAIFNKIAITALGSGVTPEMIKGRSRIRSDGTIYFRKMFCYYARKAGHFYTTIGEFLERDHATVRHACKSFEKKYVEKHGK